MVHGLSVVQRSAVQTDQFFIYFCGPGCKKQANFCSGYHFRFFFVIYLFSRFCFFVVPTYIDMNTFLSTGKIFLDVSRSFQSFSCFKCVIIYSDVFSIPTDDMLLQIFYSGFVDSSP